MPRLISFAATLPQFLDGTKTVTRRVGWKFLTEGTILEAVEKAQGIPKGGTVTRIGLIRVVDVTSEPLSAITSADVIAEGFPGWTPGVFVEFFCSMNGGTADQIVTRIEFEHIDHTRGNVLNVQQKLFGPPEGDPE